MDAIALVQRLHQHRRWVNDQLLSAVEELSNDQLHHRFPIGQGSIWLTLTHLYAAEYVWLAALGGDPNPVAPGDAPQGLPGNQQGDDAITSLVELRDRWTELDQQWVAYLNDLTPGSLDQTVGKIASISGKRADTRRSDVLLHVCTHAQYTTAQLINMLRHTGVDSLPDPMLITLARNESTGSE